MKYLFWNLSEVEYKGWKDILSFGLRKSNTFRVGHVMKEKKVSEGVKLYAIDSSNTPEDKEVVWNYIFKYALENSSEFVFQYELNEKSEWLKKDLMKIEGVSISNPIDRDKHKIVMCYGNINHQVENLIKKIVQKDLLSFDQFAWQVEVIDEKLDRDLFVKGNFRSCYNGRGYVASELTEEEIDKFNQLGYVINEIAEYKHRFTLSGKIDEEYIKMIEEEAEYVFDEQVADLMGIKTYLGERQILFTDLKHRFIICLSEDEMREIHNLNIDTSRWKLICEKDEYIAPNDHLSVLDRINLSFRNVNLESEKISEAVNKFFAKLKES
ncbi:hypothetical protein [Oceanirhabdus sp. W0125-5]|uniref:hypothetical protein n=1 Tax=Oceanirhabdus sp. W0125-5 TaxID=2999116 RepID=UPI0022F333C3|nr:hypothetical protein [Oceanirhabdus sp. W0125-5]WBW96985.1 hypothetical protein OW730_25340 [Oceanirhabdus sp. W0125-5]